MYVSNYLELPAGKNFPDNTIPVPGFSAMGVFHELPGPMYSPRPSKLGMCSLSSSVNQSSALLGMVLATASAALLGVPADYRHEDIKKILASYYGRIWY
jgi:hypothetical protein